LSLLKLLPHRHSIITCQHVHGEYLGVCRRIDIHDERLCHRKRLTDACALDHQVIESPLVAEALHGLEQVATERAAYAAVVQLNHLSVLLDKLRLFDLVSVEVDLTHVVHDHCHLQFVSIVILPQNAL
jgi:hypothetical protein